ncbi:DUF1642 domain-containing protein [Priestia megaterium]|uniref:DUF1642 domain-containing protein n=1 Tax=Priestia megaterium TaxID=1404 RepID=UPI0036716C43
MNKVKIPKEIAEAIETAKTKYSGSGITILLDVYDERYTFSEISKISKHFDGDLQTLMHVLVNGYEVEKTPEENFRDYYEYLRKIEDNGLISPAKRKLAATERVGVNMTLRLLDIEVDGVNK